MKRIASLLLCLACLPGLLAQANFSREQALTDLRFLQESIATYNPALFAYNPDFGGQAQALFAELPDSLSLRQLFGYASRLCALSHEGHFSLGDWEDPLHAPLAAGEAPFLPFTVFIHQGQLYVELDLSENVQLQPGDKILSLNGKPYRQILEILRVHYPADGTIDTYPRHKLSQDFPWLYHLYVDQSAEFSLTYQPRGQAEIKTLTLPALTSTQRKANYQQHHAQEEPPVANQSDFYTLRFHDTHAELTLKSFDWRLVEKYTLKPKKFYQDIFERLQQGGVDKLLIDLRGNTGGRNGFADEMVRFIQPETHAVPFLKKTVSWEGKEKTYPVPKRHKYAFAGETFVLTDGLTYSAGATLARYLKEFAGAIVVGEETGTRYEGFAAGSDQAVTLPQSELTFSIPRYHIFFPPSPLQQTSNRGLLPDHVVSPDLAERLAGEDVVKALAVKKMTER